MSQLLVTQEHLHEHVQMDVAKYRDGQRRAASTGESPNFTIGDYVLVARVRGPGLRPKLMAIWTGPWRVVGAESASVYGVQDIVTGVIQAVHIARLRFIRTCT